MPLYPKQLYRSVQYGVTAPKGTTTVCPVHNFPPPSDYSSATSHTGRQSCRVKSLFMRCFWLQIPPPPTPRLPSPDTIAPSQCNPPPKASICKRIWSQGIDSKESKSPCLYVAWRAGMIERVFVPARQAENRFLGSLKGLQIRAQYSEGCRYRKASAVTNANKSIRELFLLYFVVQNYNHRCSFLTFCFERHP